MRKMNLVKKCGWFLGCFLAVATMTACSDDENKIDDFIPGEGFSETMAVLPEKGSQVMKFTANDAWSAKSNQTWLKLDGQAQSSGKMGAVEIYVSYEVNETPADRTADITLLVGSTIKTIKVTQKATGRVISFDGVAGDTLKMTKGQKEYEVTILANVTWEFVADSLSAADKGWIEVTPKDGKVSLKVSDQDGSARCARLVFRDKNFTSYTKVLFVAVEGWGENYLTWSLGKTEYPKAGDTTKLVITNVPDVKPVALTVDKDGNVEATEVDWVHFAQAPAAKSILNTQTMVVTVDSSEIIKNRYAYIFVVAEDMTVEEVVANKDELNGVRITQLAAQPMAKAESLLRWFGEKWEPVTRGFTATKLTWTMEYSSLTIVGMMEQYPLAMTIESNCTLSNPREMGKKSDGTEVELPYMTPGQPIIPSMMAAKPDKDEAGFWQMKASGGNPNFFMGVSGYLLWDLLDEDGNKVGEFRYDLECLPMTVPLP